MDHLQAIRVFVRVVETGGFGRAALLAVGYEEDKEVVVELQNLTDHLENLVIAFQKDIKLLAGAAGMSSLASSLVGNREIIRTIGLDPSIRKELVRKYPKHSWPEDPTKPAPRMGAR